MREDGRIPVIRDDVSTSASESAIFKSNAYGFMRSMEKEGIEISRNSFFCFGAGKTGSAICTAAFSPRSYSPCCCSPACGGSGER